MGRGPARGGTGNSELAGWTLVAGRGGREETGGCVRHEMGAMREGPTPSSSFLAHGAPALRARVLDGPAPPAALHPGVRAPPAPGWQRAGGRPHLDGPPEQPACLYGNEKMTQPTIDGDFDVTNYLTNHLASYSTGFDVLRDLQGQVGGGHSGSAPSPDDSFLFQSGGGGGGVDRYLSQIYSIYLDS
ncbi:unnamed protein product [Arctogadus glacialis]